MLLTFAYHIWQAEQVIPVCNTNLGQTSYAMVRSVFPRGSSTRRLFSLQIDRTTDHTVIIVLRL